MKNYSLPWSGNFDQNRTIRCKKIFLSNYSEQKLQCKESCSKINLLLHEQKRPINKTVSISISLSIIHKILNICYLIISSINNWKRTLCAENCSWLIEIRYWSQVRSYKFLQCIKKIDVRSYNITHSSRCIHCIKKLDGSKYAQHNFDHPLLPLIYCRCLHGMPCSFGAVLNYLPFNCDHSHAFAGDMVFKFHITNTALPREGWRVYSVWIESELNYRCAYITLLKKILLTKDCGQQMRSLVVNSLVNLRKELQNEALQNMSNDMFEIKSKLAMEKFIYLLSWLSWA